MRGNRLLHLPTLIVCAVLPMTLTGLAVALSADTSTQLAAQDITAAPTAAFPDVPPVVTRNAEWTPVVRSFEGVEMVLVPPGCFMMGSTEEQAAAVVQQCEAIGWGLPCSPESLSDAMPAHRVCFSRPFWIDRTEVSNGQVTRLGGAAEDEDAQSYPDHPRQRITWYEAQNYCNAHGARLPTESEWEYAARGPDALIYPWGNMFDATRLNACDVPPCDPYWSEPVGRGPSIALVRFNSRSDDDPNTMPVGSYPAGASWVGALDMSGNVWEWVNDEYDENYYSVSPVEDPGGPLNGRGKVIRGGSWYNPQFSVHAAVRADVMPFDYIPGMGFRCARPFVMESAATPTPAPEIGSLSAIPTQPTATGNRAWTPVMRSFDGVEMMLVPSGCFPMGSDYERHSERPVHEVCFDEAFWIDRYEVTNGQFARLDGEAGRESDSRGADQPRENISWFEARDFCVERGARLPTEAEWEYAARGPNGLSYPWGDTFDGTRANFCDVHCELDVKAPRFDDGYPTTAPVGSYPEGASWVGALDMAGNVGEWVNDWYAPDYYAQGPTHNPVGPSRLTFRGLRGGSWSATQYGLRASGRAGILPEGDDPVLGFRCARSLAGEIAPTATIPAIVGAATAVPTLANEPALVATRVSANSQWTPLVRAFDGVEMVLVPAGCFLMGSEDGGKDERPVHELCFDRPFWIDRYEVSNEQFARFGGVDEDAPTHFEGDRPRWSITWFEAQTFCELRRARLPTEAEWEYAARGPDGLVYPWGDDFEGTRVNYCDSSCVYQWRDPRTDDGYPYRSPVGFYPAGASWVGALDMSGNVAEWVDGRHTTYGMGLSETSNYRVVRGGSYYVEAFYQRAASRDARSPHQDPGDVGFRCARPY